MPRCDITVGNSAARATAGLSIRIRDGWIRWKRRTADFNRHSGKRSKKIAAFAKRSLRCPSRLHRGFPGDELDASPKKPFEQPEAARPGNRPLASAMLTIQFLTLTVASRGEFDMPSQK